MLYLLVVAFVAILLISLVLLQNPKGTSSLVTQKIGVKNHLYSATWIAGALVMIIALVG